MTMIIRHQTKDEPLTRAEQNSDILNDVTIAWLDFEDAIPKENDFLIENYNFDYSELEDVIKGVPRVKYKSYNDYQYMVSYSIHRDNFIPIALNVFLDGKTLVTCYQHHFESLMEIVKMNVHKRDPDPDCANIVTHTSDMMVDKYSDFVYTIENEVYNLEDAHVDDTHSRKVMDNVFRLRSNLVKIKRVSFLMQELVNIIKTEGNLIVDYKHSMYIQHIDDHIIKQNNITRTSREVTNEIRGNFELYSSFRMDSIMQVLTPVPAIFSPLTFIVGVYEMNFEYMPELKWHYGHLICLTIMLPIPIALILFFKKKKWL